MQEVVLATAENLARHAKGAKEQKQSTATNKENLLLESCSTHLTFPVFHLAALSLSEALAETKSWYTSELCFKGKIGPRSGPRPEYMLTFRKVNSLHVGGKL